MADKVPRLVAKVDVRNFKLDATDGFVLTRIDGRLGAGEIARDTGLPPFQIERTLEKLEKLGVIEMVDRAAARPAAPPPAPPPARAVAPMPAAPGASPKYDPRELEEDVYLSPEQRKRILDLFYSLDDLSHYALLSVDPEADKKTVKRAYFELAALLHPDRYFQKDLGSFKAKMELLFGRITEAHDTLVDVGRRLDYDAYLGEVAATKGIEAALERAVEESRRAAEAALAAPTSSAPAPIPSAPPPSSRSAPTTQDLQARRAALARRLLGSHPGRTVPPVSSPPSPPNEHLKYASSADAVDALRRRYEDRVVGAMASQVRKHVSAAEEALAKNDFVAAASAMQFATKFAPDDADLAMRYQEVKNEADKVLAESYTKQAAYEQKSQHWPEAARTWQRVARIRVGDVNANAQAAKCLLKADTADLHEAAEHARVAVTAEPSVIEHHVTLAEVYIKAGLLASAKRAADAGLALDPKNADLQAIAKKAKA